MQEIEYNTPWPGIVESNQNKYSTKIELCLFQKCIKNKFFSYQHNFFIEQERVSNKIAALI